MRNKLKYVAISAVVLLSIFFIERYAYRVAKEREVANFMQQELLLAKAAAGDIESLIRWLLADLGAHNEVSFAAPNGLKRLRRMMQALYRAHATFLFAVGAADERGNVVHCFPDEASSGLGRLDSRRFPPVGHTSVFSGDGIIEGKRTGVLLLRLREDSEPPQEKILFMVLDMDSISREFIGRVKLGKSCHAWLLDEDGVVIANPHNPSRIGKNEYEFCVNSGEESLRKLCELIQRQEEGSGMYYLPGGGKKMLGFAKVRIPGMRWCVGVSASSSEVAEQLAQLRRSHFLLVAAGFLVAVLIGLSWYRAERSALIAGEKERLAGTLEREVKERTQELARTTRMLQSVLDCATAYGIFATDEAGTITLWSKGAEALTGYAAEDVVGKDSPLAVLETEQPEGGDFAAFARKAAEEKTGVEVKGRRKDGSTFPLLLSLAVLEKEGGRSAGWVGIMRDISIETALRARLEQWARQLERKVEQRTRALRESEEKYRKLFEGAKDGILVVDKEDGTILDCNRAFERLLGYSRQELKGKKTWELRPPELVEQAEEHFKALKRGAHIIGPEPPFMTKDGRTVEIEFSTEETELEGRRVFQCICRDVTEQRRLQREVENYRSYLESILRDAPAGVNTTDLDGVIQVWGGSSPQMFGYRAEEVVGKMKSIDLHADAQEGRKVLEITSAQGEFSGEVTLKRKDGSTFPSLLHVSKLRDAEGKHIGYAGFNIDITERKKLEEQLLHAQKMEGLGRLAGGIAHDFNNILEGILGYASFIRARLEDKHPFRKYIEVIERSALRGADLTRQLLTFSRSGRHAAMPVNMNRVVEETMKLVERSAKENVELRMELEPHLFVASADPAQMEQAILNICINALDAMPEGGVLTVRTENIIVDEQFARRQTDIQPGPHVVLTISDTGVGMDESVKEKIFEPFFTTKEPGQGTGLGLSIVYTVIKNHRGCIEVESEPGEGTTFRLYIPASMKTIGVKPKVTEERMPRGEEGILVVDDEDTICELADNILSDLGYRVFVAHSGQEALDIYREKGEEIDLVILDIVMPGLDGVKTFHALREMNGTVRVLLSSGYTRSHKVDALLQNERVGYLEKPYSASALAQAVKDALER